MVRYYSDDGVFSAPVDRVWKLIQAHNPDASRIHPGILSMKGTPQPDGSVIADMSTRGPDGKPVAQKWRFVMKPPFSQSVEMIEGPMKGSWITTTYLPEGSKTRCVTFAEWRVQGMTDDSALWKMANDFFDGGFEEDVRYLRTMP